MEHDGVAALRSAEWFRPTFALIDLTLPNLDGFEVAKAMRGMPAMRDCVLAAMTGWTTDEHAARASAAGFNRYLLKPLSIDALREALMLAPVPTRPTTH
jgi:CheY-like chemotaxis protein